MRDISQRTLKQGLRRALSIVGALIVLSFAVQVAVFLVERMAPPHFTVGRFAKVNSGWTKENVRKYLGKPSIETFDDFTYNHLDTGYIVLFDKRGVVEMKDVYDG